MITSPNNAVHTIALPNNTTHNITLPNNAARSNTRHNNASHKNTPDNNKTIPRPAIHCKKIKQCGGNGNSMIQIQAPIADQKRDEVMLLRGRSSSKSARQKKKPCEEADATIRIEKSEMAAKENQKATKKQSQIKQIKQTRQKLQGKGAKNGEQKCKQKEQLRLAGPPSFPRFLHGMRAHDPTDFDAKANSSSKRRIKSRQEGSGDCANKTRRCLRQYRGCTHGEYYNRSACCKPIA